ncbi:MAG: Ppx/GppA phosphatase family protein [Armatimonadota bacterium]
MKPQRIAAMDLGSNSFLLTIVQTGNGGIRTLHDSCIITQLSKDMDQHGDLAQESISRGLAAVRQFRDILSKFEVDVLLPVGTAVFRKAANSQVMLNEVKKILGTEVEVISGQSEAELSFNSIAKDPIFARTPGLCVVDLGGGSAEIASAGIGAMALSSFPIGAMAMKQAHVSHDPVTDEEIAAITEIVRKYCGDLIAGHRSVVGVGGAFVNFGGFNLGTLNLEAIHGMSITTQRLEVITHQLCAATEDQRKQIPGLEPERAGVIHVSAIVASELMKALGVSEFRVSVKGLRWGLIYEACDANRH